jgi:hypothetical protein
MVVIYCYDLIIIPIAWKQCKRAIVELEETFLIPTPIFVQNWFCKYVEKACSILKIVV